MDDESRAALDNVNVGDWCHVTSNEGVTIAGEFAEMFRDPKASSRYLDLKRFGRKTTVQLSTIRTFRITRAGVKRCQE